MKYINVWGQDCLKVYMKPPRPPRFLFEADGVEEKRKSQRRKTLNKKNLKFPREYSIDREGVNFEKARRKKV